jgi:hypothetical protein
MDNINQKYLDKAHGSSWVGKKLLCKIDCKAATVVAISLKGNLVNLNE